MRGDGSVWGWGDNLWDQLGTATTETCVSDPSFGGACDRKTPAAIAGFANIVAVAGGNQHTIALRADGTVWGVGSNTFGQLGNGTDDSSTTPVQATGLTNISVVGAGWYYSAAAATGAALPQPTPAATVQVNQAPGGTVTITPPGPHTAGQQVKLTATPNADQLFLGFKVAGANVRAAGIEADTWVNPLTIAASPNVVVTPLFAARPAFGDVPAGDPAAGPVAQLAARAVINGCDASARPPLFCPSEPTLRHQMAALIVRAMPGWADETGLPTFSDNTADTELMTRVATVQRHNVAQGYQAEVCLAQGKQPPCYGPLDKVTYGQVLLFIARAMVEKGYWTLQPDNPAIFPELNGPSAREIADHRAIVTYLHYAGAPPDVNAAPNTPFRVATPGRPVAAWGDAAPRGWFARALWQALDSYFGH